MKRTVLIVGLVVVFALCISAAQAVVLYSNIGPENNYCTDGWLITGGSMDPSVGFWSPQAIADQFKVSGGSFTLSSIEVPLGCESGTSYLSVSLFADNSELPGRLIESLGAQPVNKSSGIITFASITHPLLQDGQTYWVGVSDSKMGTKSYWCWNFAESSGTYAYGMGNDWQRETNTLAAMRVNGNPTAVPEQPATLLAVLGILTPTGLVFRRRK